MSESIIMNGQFRGGAALARGPKGGDRGGRKPGDAPSRTGDEVPPALLRKLRRKAVLTSGDVAKLCSVAPRTVCKWADSGRLPCYRIPGSQDRRFLRANVLRFLGESGMAGVLGGRASPRVILVGLDDRDAAAVEGAAGVVTWLRAADAFDAGTLCSPEPPEAAVIDLAGMPRAAGLQLASRVRRLRPDCPVVLLACEDDDPKAVSLAADCLVLARPFDPAALAGLIGSLCPGAGE